MCFFGVRTFQAVEAVKAEDLRLESQGTARELKRPAWETIGSQLRG